MKSSKITLTGLGWIKNISFNLFTIIMLCSHPPAQGIFFKSLFTSEGTVYPNRIENYPAAGYVHGFGISRYSDIDPERAFSEAYESALEDLNSSLMTSVILEFYGTGNLQPRLHSEFAIHDDELDMEEVISKDSMRVEDWAVYIIGYKNRDSTLPQSVMSHPPVQNRIGDQFNPVQIENYWVASGSATYSRFNAYRSFSLAKQDALQNLSLHIQTIVQGSQRALNESMSSINYQTSRNVFSNIHVIKRERDDNRVRILIAVKEEDVLTWRE